MFFYNNKKYSLCKHKYNTLYLILPRVWDLEFDFDELDLDVALNN